MTDTVLVVSEHDSAIECLVAALAASGVAAAGARGFATALSMLEQMTPSLMIADVQLGAYNGLHLLMRARARRPEVRTVIIGPLNPALAREAGGLGADRYLPVPSTETVVSAALTMLSPLPDNNGVHISPPRAADRAIQRPLMSPA